jgi:hypothetical protein
MATVPQQIPSNLDTVSGRSVSWQLGTWVYGDVVGNVTQSLTSGATGTINDNTSSIVINPAALLAALALKMPANPVDGDIVNIIFGGTIAAGATVVTAFTLAANTGQHLYGATPTATATGGTSYQYKYNAANTTWYQIAANEVAGA